jgi:hypothetical protein
LLSNSLDLFRRAFYLAAAPTPPTKRADLFFARLICLACHFALPHPAKSGLVDQAEVHLEKDAPGLAPAGTVGNQK